MVYSPDVKLLGDGYIVINGIGYQPRLAKEVAKHHLLYFQKNEHFPEPNFPTDIRLVDRHKHDVTQAYDHQLKMIASKIEKLGPIMGYELMIKNFPNNGLWDMQGRLGLPSQSLRLDEKGQPVPHPKKPGRFASDDQYAWYNGEAHRAGWFSNYILGYTTAAARVPSSVSILGAEIFSLLKNQRLDNPKDIEAIEQGYYDYLKKIQGKPLPSPGSFMNK